jgi:alkanesulfonate monooxygenase SsuD/methylene tetrahydromethanopterin reductase-like flavin-dependent oxidoreductase (luciferase family)
MITKFDSSFAGHIDMDHVGYGGTPVNDRWFPNDQLVTVFPKAEAISKAMDRLGYGTFWMAEHHFQPEGYECIPNVLMLSLHLAHLTEHLRFGCGFNITPMWHPLRLAEDFATADILTGGRITFGVGRGYHTREVETLGAPLLDQPANRSLFEEQVEIIFKALREEKFSHHGTHYDLPPEVPYRGYQLRDLSLVPRPTHPFECWQPIQSASQRALDFMAKHGIKGVIGGGSAEGGAVHSVVLAWQETQARFGRQMELGADLAFGYQYYIAPSREQGIKEAGKFYEENLKIFGPLRLVRALTDQQIEDMADPKKAPTAGLPTITQAIRAGGFLCGTPEQIIEDLKAVEARYPGLERIIVTMPVGTPQTVILEQLERFATEVMPAFQGRVADTAMAH